MAFLSKLDSLGALHAPMQLNNKSMVSVSRQIEPQAHAKLSTRTARPHSVLRPPSAHHRVNAATTEAAEASSPAIIPTLKSAAKFPGSVPPAQVLDAMLQLEKQKLGTEGWHDLLAAPGRKWRLVCTAGTATMGLLLF